MGKHDKGPSEEWVRASDCSCPIAIAEFDKSQGVSVTFSNWNIAFDGRFVNVSLRSFSCRTGNKNMKLKASSIQSEKAKR